MRAAYVFAALLCLTLVAAQNTTISRTPNITADFSENVTLNTITLTKITGPVPVLYNGSSGITQLSTISLFTTLFDFLRTFPDHISLENRYYTFTINVSDNSTQNNNASFNFTFNVSAPGQILTLLQPQFGGFNTSDTDVVVQSELPSDCRWVQDTFAVVNPSWFLSQMQPMTPDGTLRGHTIKNLFATTGTVVAQGASVSVSVTCKDLISGIYTPMIWPIIYTNTSAVISVSANPNPIIDSTRAYTTVSVSSDQDVWCTLANKGIATNAPDIFGPRVYDNYLTSLSGQLTLPVGTPPPFNITVECFNRAGLNSTNKLLIDVNYAVPVTITMLSPAASKSKQYRLNFTTNPSVQCTAFRGGTGIVLTKNADPGNEFWRDENFQNDGIYVYNISCSVPGIQNKTTLIHTLTVDSTPPVLNNIDARPLSCDLTKLTFTFNATATPPSPIAGYNYTIRNANGTIIASGQQATPLVIRSNLNLVNDSQYSVSGQVYDSAGNVAPQDTTTIKATTNKAPGCDVQDPITSISINYTNKLTTIQVLCVDNVACKNEYRWNHVNTSQSCNVNLSFTPVNSLNITQSITTKQRICWMVSDTSNRFASGEQVVDVKNISNITAPINSCANGKIDVSNLESDVDCGGPICAAAQGKLCANNKTCNVNKDCSGGWCSLNTCKSSSCTDGAQNGAETGVDCGGSCGACIIEDSSCLEDTDCADGKVCKRGVCADLGELEDPDPEAPSEPPAQGSSFLSVVFMILGSLLMLCGFGTLVLYAEPKKKSRLEDEAPIVPYEETALSRETIQDTQEQTKTSTNRRKQTRAVKKQRRASVLSEFDTPEELNEVKNVTHKHIEAAYDKFKEKEFKETTKHLLEDGKVEKKDVAVAITDLSAKDKIDDDALEDLKKEFGITDEKVTEKKKEGKK